MPQLYPIPERCWITKTVYKKVLRKMYGPDERLKLQYLPHHNIQPEDIRDILCMDVELMLGCLQGGAWLGTEDWQKYARYTIANRLRVRADLIFRPPFDTIKDILLEFQLKGGPFTMQDQLRKFAVKLIRHPHSTVFQLAGSRLILSTLEEVQANAVIQPFHWIRATVAASEPSAVFGMALHKAEMRKQKIALCKFIRA